MILVDLMLCISEAIRVGGRREGEGREKGGRREGEGREKGEGGKGRTSEQ